MEANFIDHDLINLVNERYPSGRWLAASFREIIRNNGVWIPICLLDLALMLLNVIKYEFSNSTLDPFFRFEF